MFMHRREKDPSLLQRLGFCWVFLTCCNCRQCMGSAVAETDDDLIIILAQIKILVFRISK